MTMQGIPRLHTTLTVSTLVALTGALWWAQTTLGQGFLPHGYRLT